MTAEDIFQRNFYPDKKDAFPEGIPMSNTKDPLKEAVIRSMHEFADAYAREAIKADRERVAAAATLLIEKKGEKVLTGQLRYIAYDGDHFEIDPASILNLPIEIPKNEL